jgi:hypothetical protein
MLSSSFQTTHHRAASSSSPSSSSSSTARSRRSNAAFTRSARRRASSSSRVAIFVPPRATTSSESDKEEVEEELDAKQILNSVKETKSSSPTNRRQADSTDFMATFLTRRFGLKGGLAWLGLLTFGVVSEQLKTRRETREEKENTKAVAKEKRTTVKINDSTSYVELVKGGGEYVQQGFLCGANVTVKDLDKNETAFDTRKNNRPIGFVYSKTRPPPVIPYDVNESFSDDRYVMRNGSRRVFTTTSGSDGLTFKDGSYVKPNANVEIDFEFTKVSIPPS